MGVEIMKTSLVRGSACEPRGNSWKGLDLGQRGRMRRGVGRPEPDSWLRAAACRAGLQHLNIRRDVNIRAPPTPHPRPSPASLGLQPEQTQDSLPPQSPHPSIQEGGDPAQSSSSSPHSACKGARNDHLRVAPQGPRPASDSLSSSTKRHSCPLKLADGGGQSEGETRRACSPSLS